MKKTNSHPDVSDLLKSIEEIRYVCFNQQEEINELKRENKVLRQENKGLKNEIKGLKTENQNLKTELAFTKHKKDSSNSSMPPSSGIGKTQRARSLRKSSGKKPGGQPGHKSTTLKMTETPDLLEDHMPSICEQCGTSLLEIPADFAGRRQVVDLPPIQLIVTEHRVFSKQCTCGHCTKVNSLNRLKHPYAMEPIFKVL